MAPSKEPFDPAAGPSGPGVTGSHPERDPQQEAIKTPQGVEFLHAGSGNSPGDGLTAGGAANIESRQALPDTNAEDEPEGDSASGALRSWPGRFVLLLTWAAVHHTAAGVRYLLFDAGCGNRYRQARRSAWTVHGIAIAATLLVLLAMAWGAVR